MVADTQEEVRKEYKPIHDYSNSFTPVEEYRPLNVKDALSYLDKIKANFSLQPDIYHQFLDIMKEFKSQSIDTPGVIERVSSLFQGYPTLIAGFNTFLPPGYHIECFVEDDKHIIKVTTPTGITSVTNDEQLCLIAEASHSQVRREPIEFNDAITFVNTIKSRFATRPEIYKRFLDILQSYQRNQTPIQEVYAEIQSLFSGSNELLEKFKQFMPENNQRRKRLGMTSNRGISKKSKGDHIPEIETSNVRSNIEEQFRINFSEEEKEFFKKAKAYLSNEATYNAFVKVLNLFSQQMFDQNTLVNRVESFIGGNKELFDWFKDLVGYDGKDQIIDNVPLKEENGKSNMLNNGYTYLCGPSYRRISQTWQDSECSGRDALCWDVLNDNYISCPTWSSENSNLVALKKNQHEEALHRVEEERYDYDLNIEANLNTIALLEPIAKKISSLSVEEKQSFKLSPGLGSTSSTNYRRIIKKVYGNEMGLEIIDLLYNNPIRVVPILLKRLKQKDDEWKRAQREWNKIWREIETKNYWKSLDYKGITFKLTDKKNMSARFLVSDADQKRSEKSVPHFSYSFGDATVFKDVARLLHFFLDKQPIYNTEDCGLMREFLNTFISAFFNVNDVEPSIVEMMDTAHLMDVDNGEDDDDDDDDKSSIQSIDSKSVKKKTTRANRRLRRGKNQVQNDDKLLKDVLTRNLNKKKSNDSTDEDNDDENENDYNSVADDDDDNDDANSINNNDGDDEDEEYDAEEDGDDEDEGDQRHKKYPRFQKRKTPNMPNLTEKMTKETKTDPETRKIYNFFANNGFYCFFRLYQTLYQRLYDMKIIGMKLKQNPEKISEARNEAHNLGITHRKFKALNMDEKKGYYHLLLSLIDRFFESDLDQQTFEDSTRYIFGNKAYTMFTIDKLVLSVLRYIHVIITDTQSQDLLELFQQEHKAEVEDQGDIITYRTRVAGLIKSMENTYHMAFNLNNKTLNIQLLGDDNGAINVDQSLSGYDAYVANYIDWANETKGINQSSLTPRFLKRNLKQKTHQTRNITVKSGMQYKICRNSYHMFYIIGTEDTFIRRANKPQSAPSFKLNDWINTKMTHSVDADTEAYRVFNQ